ncbi:hypothetical protein HRF68_18045 [Pseudomonas stutzeri]|nr:hypothetical protein [Stutzerimonas stutzeri]
MVASIAISAIPLFAGHVTWWRAAAHFLGFTGMAGKSRRQDERRAVSAIAMAIMANAFLRAILGEVVAWTAGRHAVSLALLFCLVASALFKQPFVDVYGAGPRGLFQWEQVIANVAGSILGALGSQTPAAWVAG